MTPAALKVLNVKLWAGVEDIRFVAKDKVPQVTIQELDEIIACIKEHHLMCDVRPAGFFGSIGLLIMQGPKFPGADNESLLFLTQYHLPKKYYPQSHRPTLGSPPDDAWALFSSLALSVENVSRLKWAGLKAPRSSKVDYAY